MDREHGLIRKWRIEDRESERFVVPREGLQPAMVGLATICSVPRLSSLNSANASPHAKQSVPF